MESPHPLFMDHDDPIIRAAKRDLADLDAKRSEIASFLERYQRYKAADSGEAPSMPSLPLRSPPADKVMSAVHDILMSRGDALTLSAIFDELIRRGIVIGGNHPKQNLSQKLSAHPALKSYGRRGWYFADAIPPCLQPTRQLSGEDIEYEEGPDTEVTRPLQSNGAADWHSA